MGRNNARSANTTAVDELTRRMFFVQRARTCDVEDAIGAWFPPYWPGWFLAIVAAIVGHGEHWDDRVFITIATIGNAVFYAWIVSLALNADVESRGPIGRHFLR